jgi:hypothetical protein
LRVRRLYSSSGVYALLTLISVSFSNVYSQQSIRNEPHFEEVAQVSGIDFVHTSGGPAKDYIIESVAGGVAMIDYDNDGWLDIYFVNGSNFHFQDNPNSGSSIRSKLFRNNRDGTFSDSTMKAGVGRIGWCMGAAAADYDNDGDHDLYVTCYGSNTLYHNNGDGTFSDVSEKAGAAGGNWSTGAAWGDYDRDGDLDLYVARYVDFNRAEIPPKGSSKFCQYRGLAVQCGPRGLKGLSHILYRNNGDGTFTDLTKKALGGELPEYYGFTPLWADFTNDGWPDLYVANDGTPSLFYINRGDGTFEERGGLAGCAFSKDGREQAGMGADFGDYNQDGWLDIFKTNFSDDYNNLYMNLGGGNFSDHTDAARILTVSWKELGWATKFFDYDNDGWSDIFITNGHVYPEVDQWQADSTYKQRPQVLRNLQNGTFRDVTAQLGADMQKKISGRGASFGDLDNDGDIDVVINNLDGVPSLLRSVSSGRSHWLTLRLRGVKSNRNGIGARVKLRSGKLAQLQEVHQSGGFLSSNDTRVHFGLGENAFVDSIEIRWPSGLVQHLKDLKLRQIITVTEGSAVLNYGR